MLACWTVLFDLFRPLDYLLEMIANDAVDSFPVQLWQIIECNGDFQYIQLFDFLFILTYFRGYWELNFRPVGAVGGGLLFGEIPVFQSYRYAQPDELTAAVLGEYEGKRGQMVSVDSIFSTYNVDCHNLYGLRKQQYESVWHTCFFVSHSVSQTTISRHFVSQKRRL